jgi:hypothetical protein
MFLPLFPVVRIPIEAGRRGYENRSLGDEQLDDGIVDTLVSAPAKRAPA